MAVTVDESVAEGTQISNQARLIIEQTSPVLSDDPNTSPASDPTVFTVSNATRLLLEKSLRDVNGPPLKPGDLVEFSLVTTNIGGRLAQNIEVIDPLSALLTEINANGKNVANQIARWQIPQLNAGDSRTFILSARVSEVAQAGSLLTNQFAARLPNEDFTLSPEISAIISVDDFSFTKQARPILSDAFVANGGIEYEITITNNGQSILENLIISDAIPLDFLEKYRCKQWWRI